MCSSDLGVGDGSNENGENDNISGEGNGGNIDNPASGDVLGGMSGNGNLENTANYNSENWVVLPDTGKRVGGSLAFFLVIDLCLWYSYFRRRKMYESKNENTKICTRCCKDSA